MIISGQALIPSIKWGTPTHYDVHGIAHLRSVTSHIEPDSLGDVLTVPGPYQRIFWAKLGPGGFIVPHIDAGPYWDRWHIPVQPNGWFWQNGEYFQPEGPAFAVRHWEPHAVWNPTSKDRIHLIVDRAVPPEENPEYHPLELTQMITEIQQMIDNI